MNLSFGVAGPGPSLIIVDDTDPSIKYSGTGWFLAQGNNSTLGSSGPVYNGTQHGTTAPGVISFTFNGDYVHVYGTSTSFTTSNSSTSPQWECDIDQTSIVRDPLPDSPQNHWGICNSVNLNHILTVDAHILTIRVTSVPDGEVFWFDSIWLQYGPSVPVDNAVIEMDNAIFVDNVHNEILYSKVGWNLSDFWSAKAIDYGATVTVQFWGGSLSWYGLFINGQFPSSSGEYSIDDLPQVPFQINGSIPWASQSANVTNQLIFSIPNLESGPHILQVTYLGNRSVVPLSLDYLLIQNGTSSLSSNQSVIPNVTSSSPTNPPSATPSSSKSSTPVAIGAIVGGAIGGVGGLALLLVLFLFLRRRRDSGNRTGRTKPHSTMSLITPFILSRHEDQHGSHVPAASTSTTKSSQSTALHSIPRVSRISAELQSNSLRPHSLSVNPSYSDSKGIGATNPPQVHVRNSSEITATAVPQNVPQSLDRHGIGHSTTLSLDADSGQNERERERLPLLATRTPSPSAGSSQPAVVHHEDSGIRISRVVEMPPQYTAM